MNLTSKDKSLLLFIVALIIVVWGIFSFLSNVVFATSFENSDASKIIVDKEENWLNVERPLQLSDLKNRVILLDFWSYSCVSCIQSLPEIKKLKEKFGSKLTVIGVHSRKFNNGRDLQSVKKAILKYDITYPVINDADLKIWNNFEIKAWPTYALIDVRGGLVETYVGDSHFSEMGKDISKLISKYKYQINRDQLPILPEKYSLVGNVLKFPTKLEYHKDFSFGRVKNLPVIFIANSGANNIVASSLSGNILVKIGSGDAGLADGSFELASFRSPQGLLYRNNKLYVADTGNHALRVIDFEKKEVSTLVGSGKKGMIFNSKEKTDTAKFDLASPLDLEFFPDNQHIVIANAGTHQILSYHIKSEKISVLAGDGSEGFKDGKALESSLSQTSDMSVLKNKLYFIDAGGSSLRVLDKNGKVETLIGDGKGGSGHKNGSKKDALMQHPLALMADNTGIYIADSFNHKLRKYSLESGKIKDLAGQSQRGNGVGSKDKISFDEPEGMIAIRDRIYIADTNNNRVVSIKRSGDMSEIIDVMPPLKLSKESFLEYLPNLQRAPDIKVKASVPITLAVKLKEGWKINEAGPSFINLLEKVSEDQVNLIANFDWRVVKMKEMKLPKLNVENEYILQGVIYYCEDKKNALCRVKSYERKVIADSYEKDRMIINIALGE